MMPASASRRAIGALSTSSSYQSKIPSLWVPSYRFFSASTSGGEATSESGAKADDGSETTKKEEGSASNGGDFRTLDILVDTALIEAKALGWTNASITSAASKLGLSPAAARMIRGGPGELALRYIRQCNERLAKDLSEHPSDDAKTAALLTSAVKTRLDYMQPYHHNWASALRLIANDRKLVLKSTRESALLADELAHHVGYRTPSFIWYTDRAALISLYHATEAFWLRDSSRDQVATWTFLSAYAETAVGARETIGGAVDRVATAHDLASSSISAVVNSIRRGRGSA